MNCEKIIKTKLGDMRGDDESVWLLYFQEFLNGHKTLHDLGEYLGLDTRTLRTIFHQYGWIKNEKLYVKTRIGYLSKSSPLDWEVYNDMYKEGKSYQEIADYLNIQRKTLCNYLSLFFDNKRSMSESVKLSLHKVRKTNNERHGVDYPMQSDVIRDKSLKTLRSVWGVDNIAQITEIQIKRKKTYTKYCTKRRGGSFEKWLVYLKKSGYEFYDVFDKGIRLSHVDTIESSWVRYKFKHTECGTIFEGYFHVDGIRCPFCCPNSISLEEKNITGYIETLTDVKVISNAPILNKKHIDTYIPSFNIGFEYNGYYWHSTNHSRIHKNYHKNKTEVALSKGIKIYHIWDFDDEEIIKSLIKTKLGKVDNRLYARKLTLKPLDTTLRGDFFNNNHLHGDVGASFAFGLFDGEELVQAISFRKHKEGMEIARLATKLNTSVVGGFSKLLKYSTPCVKEVGYDKIVTYCDRDRKSVV